MIDAYLFYESIANTILGHNNRSYALYHLKVISSAKLFFHFLFFLCILEGFYKGEIKKELFSSILTEYLSMNVSLEIAIRSILIAAHFVINTIPYTINLYIVIF